MAFSSPCRYTLSQYLRPHLLEEKVLENSEEIETPFRAWRIRMFPFRCLLLLLGSLVVCGFASGQEPPAGPAPRKAASVAAEKETDKPLPAEAMAFFEKKIRPVLVAECYKCHSTEHGKKVRGGLALDTREGIRKGGDTGPVIVPGNPSRSLLIKALSHRRSRAVHAAQEEARRGGRARFRGMGPHGRARSAQWRENRLQGSRHRDRDASTGPTSRRRRWRHPR